MLPSPFGVKPDGKAIASPKTTATVTESNVAQPMSFPPTKMYVVVAVGDTMVSQVEANAT